MNGTGVYIHFQLVLPTLKLSETDLPLLLPQFAPACSGTPLQRSFGDI